jgi:tetratricopeptide (TPR) repeat protein
MTYGREEAETTATRLADNLPNLLALLDYDERHDDVAVTIGTTTSLMKALSVVGKPALMEHLNRVLQASVKKLPGDWSHAHFTALSARIEQWSDEGQAAKACESAGALLDLARAAGPDAYDNADFDVAMACLIRGQLLREVRRTEEALPLIDEAQSRFERLPERERYAAERMAASCLADKGDCLMVLGRLDEAASVFEEAVHKLTALKDQRSAAVAAAELGSVRRRQGRFEEALAAFARAGETFSRLNEPLSIAQGDVESGLAYVGLGRLTEAEEAYVKALEIWTRVGNAPGEARSLSALATLYADHMNRPQDAAVFYRRAAETFVRLDDTASEAAMRNNLADVLCALRQFDQARSEITRAIELKKAAGYALAPWTSWAILEQIETGAGNAAAAEEAQLAARDSYLGYRRAGGQIEGGPGKVTAELERQIQADGAASALDFLRDLAADANTSAALRAYCGVLEAIMTGSRDRATVTAAGLNFAAAAEALLFIDYLQGASVPPATESSAAGT